MAAVKANGMTKFIVLIIVGLAIFVGVYALKGKQQNAELLNTQPSTVVYDLTESEQQELGLTAGDTPHDTLKTLLGAVKDTRAEVKAVREQNEKLKQENNALKNNASNISQQISEALEQKQFEFEQRIEAMRRDIANSSSQSDVNATTTQEQAYPIGFGSDSSSKSTQGTGNTLLPSHKEQDTKWVDPSDAIYKDRNGKIIDSAEPGATSAFPNPFKVLDESVVGESAKQIQTNPNSERKSNVTPFFTIPQNSTLLGSISMTALIGRVPINGNVTDPYPFKIKIGQDNLIANGIELPDVEGAIVSGTATGDWTLSCVKGNVESITFVFSDGRIANAQNTKDGQNSKVGIGWLSNPNGVPCISGERKTNAPEYLASQFLLSGAGAAAQGLAQGQTTTVVDNGSVIGAVTGNQGKFILGQALGGGLQETADWFRQRYGQAFDAVYVPPGQAVVVNISQELKIDYNPSGRKVKYQHSSATRRLD
ncbi:TIGR03752 family integrating conjugative element protein [Ursidibacter sp. B-7004-1]